jgi:hypothetical protein
MTFGPKLKIDLLLLGIFLICIAVLTYCYPMPQLTWDSFYYLENAHDFRPSLRPGGYPWFIKNINGVTWSLHLIVACQYLLHFLSIWSFLRVVDKLVALKDLQYFLLGFILLTEPVALYHCFNILSDILFSSLSIAYISTLILLIRKRSIGLFILHIAFMFACVEVRHIALFYPYFSFALLVFYHRNIKLVLLYALVIFGLSYIFTQIHYRSAEKRYGVRVYSPFTGWTYANNALYSLPYIKLDTNKISDVEVRRLHAYCTEVMSKPSFRMPVIGSGFLWDPGSPLCQLREKTQDSLQVSSFQAWYLLCDVYGRYGTYLQRNYPMAYVKGYIVPNMATMVKPHEGEMLQYNSTVEMDTVILGWYHTELADYTPRHEPYRDYLNNWNNFYHQLRLALFTLAIIAALVYRKRMTNDTAKFLLPTILFVGVFYLLTLYSSWFMHRYLLPVIPLQVAVIFVMCLVIGRKKVVGKD